MKKDNKLLLFENMGKLNPDFNEAVSGDVNRMAVQAQRPANLTISKRIDTVPEFSSGFEVWFTSLGLTPDRITKSRIRMDVDNVLTKLGYK